MPKIKGGAKMPGKPKGPCSYPSCPKLTHDRYCKGHMSLVNKNYNKYQINPESNKRYGRAWKQTRDKYIKLYPLCEGCERQGRLTPTQEVHQILPLSKGGSNETNNLMALCKSCHSRIIAVNGGRWYG